MKDHKKINPLFNVFLKELKGNFQMMQTVILVNQKLIFKRVLSSDFWWSFMTPFRFSNAKQTICSGLEFTVFKDVIIGA